MSTNSKTLILDGGKGLVKIIAGAKYGEILGMHIMGPRATDLITGDALATGGEMPLEEIIAAVHSHPTVTEAMCEAGMQMVFFIKTILFFDEDDYCNQL